MSDQEIIRIWHTRKIKRHWNCFHQPTDNLCKPAVLRLNALQSWKLHSCATCGWHILLKATLRNTVKIYFTLWAFWKVSGPTASGLSVSTVTADTHTFPSCSHFPCKISLFDRFIWPFFLFDIRRLKLWCPQQAAEHFQDTTKALMYHLPCRTRCGLQLHLCIVSCVGPLQRRRAADIHHNNTAWALVFTSKSLIGCLVLTLTGLVLIKHSVLCESAEATISSQSTNMGCVSNGLVHSVFKNRCTFKRASRRHKCHLC